MATKMATNPNPSLSFIGGNGVTINRAENDVYFSTDQQDPDWRERHYMMKSSGQPIGIFKGPIDENSNANFTMYQPDQGECPMLPLEATLMDAMDWDTQIAFKTLPILEVWHYASNGILLKFPD